LLENLAMEDTKFRTFIRSPSGAVLIGIVGALILGSLATAGLNTLWLARAMVAASAVTVSAYILASSLTGGWPLARKALVVVGVLTAHLAIERLETWAQPRPTANPRLPMPPLRLMMPPGEIGYTQPMASVLGLPLAVSYLERPIGGFAGFGKIGDNDNDDVMFGIQAVRLHNLSKKSLRLSWTLIVKGEGKRFELEGSGQGRWERQLNRNDYIATNSGDRLRWTLSPLTLGPDSATNYGTAIGFVAREADADLRELARQGSLPAEYSATLILKNDESGATASLRLPFGTIPTPADDPTSRALRKLAGS
jgi:hypothetical protein